MRSAATKAQVRDQREAYIEGAKAFKEGLKRLGLNTNWTQADEVAARLAAAAAYPMTESRPRVISLPFRCSTHQFKVEGNVLYRRSGPIANWTPTQWTREMHEQVLHLFNTPTETVPL